MGAKRLEAERVVGLHLDQATLVGVQYGLAPGEHLPNRGAREAEEQDLLP